MKPVSPNHYFILANGVKLKSLEELRNSLKEMPEEIFNHHVNDNRNDFSNWIRDVFKNKKLAKEISKERSPLKIHRRIESFINEEQKKSKEIKHKKVKFSKVIPPRIHSRESFLNKIKEAAKNVPS